MSRNKLSVYNETFCSAPPLVTSNIGSLVQRATARGSVGIAKSRVSKRHKRAMLYGYSIHRFIGFMFMYNILIMIV